jgi:hypothetical protein
MSMMMCFPSQKLPKTNWQQMTVAWLKYKQNISQITGYSTKNKMFNTFTLTLQTKCKWSGITKCTNYIHVTVHHVKFLIIKPTRCTNFSNLFLEWNPMFWTVPLSINRRFSLYTQQWYMPYRFADSLRAGSGWNCSSILILLDGCMTNHCCVYSEKLLMMDRGTVRNM